MPNRTDDKLLATTALTVETTMVSGFFHSTSTLFSAGNIAGVVGGTAYAMIKSNQDTTGSKVFAALRGAMYGAISLAICCGVDGWIGNTFSLYAILAKSLVTGIVPVAGEYLAQDFPTVSSPSQRR